MKKITYQTMTELASNDIEQLYKSVGWHAYLDDFETLLNGFKNSLFILGAYSENTLIGLIRVVGDGHTIIYIQDLLVMKEYQSQGIGSILLDHVLNRYHDVRQIILLTDNTKQLRNFYQKHKMDDVTNLDMIAFKY